MVLARGARGRLDRALGKLGRALGKLGRALSDEEKEAVHKKTSAQGAKSSFGQDQKNKRNINADDKLKKVFGGKGQVSMFEMTKLVSAHLS